MRAAREQNNSKNERPGLHAAGAPDLIKAKTWWGFMFINKFLFPTGIYLRTGGGQRQKNPQDDKEFILSSGCVHVDWVCSGLSRVVDASSGAH
jgi:hypothetical protein